MQYIKRSILIVVCVMVILSSFVLPSYASYSEEEHQMMLDEGYFYDTESDFYYLDFEAPSLYASYTPNFPDFDVNKIPWYKAPKYITNILEMTLEKAYSATTFDNYYMPFVVVLTNGTVARVLVGVNVALGLFYTADPDDPEDLTYGICTGLYPLAYPALASYPNSILYQAYFNCSTYECTSDWAKVDGPLTAGDSGRVSYYPRIAVPSSVFDFYCYGGNHGLINPSQGILKLNTIADSILPYFHVTYNNSLGFTSSILTQPAELISCYFTTFTPTTKDMVEIETQKSMLDTLKNLPSKIASSIKGFFTNLGDRISGFFENLKNYLLYFQETKPEHVNPFADILTDVKTFFDNQIDDVGDFKNSLTSTLNNVVSYIESGSGIINTFLSAVPVLSAFVTFFVVFCIVRKVIGR